MLRSLRDRAGKAGVLWALAFFFFPTCARDRVHRDARPDEIRHKLEALFPIGSPVAAARDFLIQDGFVCSDSDGGFAGTPRKGRFVYCDRSRTQSFMVSRRIQIGLFYEAGRIVETAVTAGLVGP